MYCAYEDVKEVALVVSKNDILKELMLHSREYNVEITEAHVNDFDDTVVIQARVTRR